MIGYTRWWIEVKTKMTSSKLTQVLHDNRIPRHLHTVFIDGDADMNNNGGRKKHIPFDGLDS